MNPLGVGIDLVYIPRVKKIVETYGERFLSKVFTPEEIQYAQNKKNSYQALASAFAVKEAFYKAIGGYPGFRFQEISLLREETKRKPSLKLLGRAKEIFQKRGGQKIDLSISHDFDYTIAIVQIWG